ncbi:hypothetical protein [Gluconobacter albidus]|uniref:hypothetical protein n=1 Tax=Gluconobacter albidus TaxID=318683 RepID=UPI001B8AE6D4|nr:hypothetical protein [Gluconobacter albidus]MBS1029165.1 hypothetical protein [Gluconobacter albidus]
MNHVPALKTATQMAVRAIGGIDAAAAVTRVGRARISEYQNRNSTTTAPVDIAIVLDEFAQEPFILQTMAHELGYNLTPIQLGHGDVAEIMEDVADKANDTMKMTIRVLADGIVTVEEAHSLGHELTKLRRVVDHALKIVRGLEKTGASS